MQLTRVGRNLDAPLLAAVRHLESITLYRSIPPLSMRERNLSFVLEQTLKDKYVGKDLITQGS